MKLKSKLKPKINKNFLGSKNQDGIATFIRRSYGYSALYTHMHKYMLRLLGDITRLFF